MKFYHSLRKYCYNHINKIFVLMQDSILRLKNIYFYRRKMQILCEAHKEVNNER